MFQLNGKNALITGAAGGLGTVIARTLIAQGARVVLTDIRPEGIETLQKELGANSFTVVGNLIDAAVPPVLIKEAEELFYRRTGHAFKIFFLFLNELRRNAP